MTEAAPNTEPYHLFERYGVELEYMIVDQETLDVRPVADTLFQLEGGAEAADIERGEISWSNELVLHVVELKTTEPAHTLVTLAEKFQDNIQHINDLLGQQLGCQLLPTGIHPWMDPHKETRLWPHENTEIYRTYDRIFNCQGHGWANLQSCHINLPFCGVGEFAKLHAAIRLILPLLPALAASTPFAEGRNSGLVDCRLEYYRLNQKKIPELAGDVIPEPVISPDQYRQEILERSYAAIRPYDTEGIMQNEWLNSRGAIARFMRGAIEIRVLDLQECAYADLAILQLIVSVLKTLISGDEYELDVNNQFQQGYLVELFQQSIKTGEQTVIRNPDYLQIFGYRGATSATMQELWQHLLEQSLSKRPMEDDYRMFVQEIIQLGPLARRIQKRLGINSSDQQPSMEQLKDVYRELGTCLQEGRLLA
jgi:gamma-glutamyl:cysteine ligase YbdK (ATP-grasp superfamily)